MPYSKRKETIWAKINRLFKSIRKLPAGQTTEVDPYVIDMWRDAIHFARKGHHTTRQASIEGNFDYTFDPIERKSVPYDINCLNTYIGSNKWSLCFGDTILCAPLDKASYPQFDYQWVRKRLKDKWAHLNSLSIALDNDRPHRNISYLLYDDRVHCEGDFKLLYGLPADLRGSTEILGVTIPWKIDFEEKAREILEASELEKLIAEIEKQSAVVR